MVLVVSFVSRTIFIYYLGKTYLGVNGLFSNVLSLLSFAELGIGQAIIFSLYKPIADGDTERMLSLMNLYGKVYRILFFVVLALGLALLPFLPYFINDFYSIPDLYLIYIMYVVNSAASYLFAYKSSFLTACQKNYLNTGITAVFYLITTFLQLTCLILFKNYILYLSIAICSAILQNVYIAHRVDKMYPFLKRKDGKPLERTDLSKIKKDVYALMLYKVGAISLNSTDNILISKFVGLITVGLYSNYALITTSVSSFLGTIFANLTASIGHLNATEDEDRKYFLFRVINFSVFWLYSVAGICIFILINPFIRCWIGDSYILGESIVLIICLNLYISAMLYPPTQYRQTMGIFVQGKYRPIISAFINIFVSILLGKYYGLSGIFWGTAITRLTTNSWYDPFIVFRKIGLSPWIYYKDYVIKIVVIMASGGFFYWISTFFTLDNFLKWVIAAIILFVSTNALYVVLYRRTEEYLYLKQVVLAIISKGNNIIRKKSAARL